MSEENATVEYETVELDLPDEVLLDLALQAHEKNVTLNEHINQLLSEYIDKLEAEKKDEH